MGSATRQHGFTLLELLLAMGLLVFAISTLIGVMSVGVGTRRAAEMRSRAVLLAERVLHDLQEQAIAEAALSTYAARSDEDIAMTIDPVTAHDVPGSMGMKYEVTFAVDPDDPKVALATVVVSWREQGDVVGQTFRRILIRERPFPQRVAQKRSPQ